MPAILLARQPSPGTPAYDAQDNGPAMLTSTGIVGGIALFFVILRLYVRRFMSRFIGADDVVMAAAMVGYLRPALFQSHG